MDDTSLTPPDGFQPITPPPSAPDEPAAAAPPSTDAADAAPAGGGIPPAAVKEGVVAMMKTVFDPEIPVNIYDLGMVYGIDVNDAGTTTVRMTLTSPMCPVAGSLPGEVQAKVATVAGVTTAKVDLVWDPPWHPDMMTDAAKLTLNMM